MKSLRQRLFAGLAAIAAATGAQSQVLRIDLLTPANESSVVFQDPLNGPRLGASATALITAAGPVSTITLTNGGTGYTSAPTVTIGGTGTGATASATVTFSVSSITLSSGGTGYPDPGTTVTISAPPSGGTQATATATVTGGVVTGIVITNAGSGYTSPPTITFSGGAGTGAAATANMTGTVSSIQLTSGGTNYVASPTVTISGGGGSGAAATATIAPTTGGLVQTVAMTSIGAGYSDQFDGRPVQFVGGGGSGATGVMRVSNGSVSRIEVTSGGSGYVTSPSVSIPAPDGVVTLSAGVTGTNAVYTTQFFVNNVPVSIPTTHSPSFTPTAAWTPPKPGEYFLTARTVDSIGNTATSLPVRVFVTGASVISPVRNTLVPRGSSVVIAADATVGLGFIRQIEFFVNGTSIGVDSTRPYSLPYTPPALGAYSITVRATDNNGAVTPASPANLIQVVNPIGNPPSIRIAAPLDNSGVRAGVEVPILVDASDADGFPTKVEIYLNGDLLTTDTSVPFTGTWTPAVPGQYHLVALAFDDKGNVAATTPTVVNVVFSLPTVEIEPLPQRPIVEGETIKIRVKANGSGGGLSSLSTVEFLVDGNVVDSLPKNPNNLEIPPPLTDPLDFEWRSTVQPGQHRLAARVTDASGLKITSAEVPVTVVVNQLPQVAVTNPTPGTSVALNTATTLQATASDVDGRIETVEFFVNGTSLGTTNRSPYQVSWTPSASGPADISAKATDNAGGTTISTAVSVTVEPPSTGNPGGPTSMVFSGNYGLATSEEGRVVFGTRGGRGTFIAISRTPAGRTYFYGDIPIGVDGAFTVRDASNAVVLSGQILPTGVSGTLGDKTFIAPLTTGSGTSTPMVMSGLLTGVANSSVAAVVGADGTVAIHAASGTNRVAGIGQANSAGAYSFDTAGGGRISGAVTPAANVISGSVTGPVAGNFILRQQPSRIVNISARTLAGNGDRTLVAGFMLSGTGTKPLLVRAVGPKLADFGVANPLADPSLTVYSRQTNAAVASNNDWGNAAALVTAAAQVGAFPLNAGSADAALLTSPALAAGTYTAVVGGGGATPRAALVEIYDTDANPAATLRITNISTRAEVAANEPLIAGFVIAGDQRKKLLIRAVGPTLSMFGVSGVLSDPRLDLLSGTNVVASNNDWTEATARVTTTTTALQAFPLDAGSKDAALVAELSPGTYTVQVSGVNGSSGTVLIEIYDADL